MSVITSQDTKILLVGVPAADVPSVQDGLPVSAVEAPGAPGAPEVPDVAEAAGATDLPRAVLPGGSRTRRRLILELGRALHRLGAASPTLEGALDRLARALAEPTQVFCTPTSLFIAFGLPGRPAATHLLRSVPGDVDLGRLTDVDGLLEDVVAGRLEVGVALAELERLESGPPRHGPRAELAAFGVASAGAAVFLGGGQVDVLASGALGAGLGMLVLAARRWASLGRLLELLGALSVSSLAAVLAHAWPSSQPALVTLAALIVFVPGYTVTVALGELAARHWVSGTARLAGAGGVFLILGLGVALGHRLAPALLRLAPDVSPAVPGEVAVAVTASLPAWALPATLFAAPLAFLVLFRARRRDAPLVLLAGLVAWSGARLGALDLGPGIGSGVGPELGAFAGALALGLVSNGIGRVLKRPASVPLVPGLMLLVPGSLGYRSVAAFLEQDALAGVEAAASTALVAAALVGGLLCANGLLPSRRSL